MARCTACSAPLPANTNVCVYCNVRNDVDLGQHRYSVTTEHSERTCPHCNIALETIKLAFDQPLYIEHCRRCFGLFFDTGEIETLLDNSVSKVFEINLKLLRNINKDRYPKNKKVKYIKCPVCQKFMRRTNFAHRSGVVIDQCLNHGVWLDSGEITHLMEWKRAGGALLHNQKKLKQPVKKITTQSPSSRYLNSPLFRRQSKREQVDLLDSVSDLILKLFK